MHKWFFDEKIYNLPILFSFYSASRYISFISFIAAYSERIVECSVRTPFTTLPLNSKSNTGRFIGNGVSYTTFPLPTKIFGKRREAAKLSSADLTKRCGLKSRYVQILYTFLINMFILTVERHCLLFRHRLSYITLANTE